jgi:uncharacterized protein (DUF1684 family)
MNKIIFQLLLFICLLSCNKKTADYLQTIDQYRSNRHQSLIIGDRAPLQQTQIAALKYYPIDATYNCKCSIERFETSSPIQIPTYAGTTTPYSPFAKLLCTIKNEKIALTIYQLLSQAPLYIGKLFLPYKDITNGDTTYGGGRYLDLLEKDINNGILVVDFNKSYNPLCAYKDGYKCPIPPKENHLTIAIHAGEQSFEK